jgi:hypothetical protein
MREEERWAPFPTFQRLPPLSDYAGPLGIIFSKKSNKLEGSGFAIVYC